MAEAEEDDSGPFAPGGGMYRLGSLGGGSGLGPGGLGANEGFPKFVFRSSGADPPGLRFDGGGGGGLLFMASELLLLLLLLLLKL